MRYTELCRMLPLSMMLGAVSYLYNDLRPMSFKRKIKTERK